MKCEICEKIYNGFKGLVSHITRTHNLSSKEYYDSYLKKENEGICLVCGKETSFISISNGYLKYCSCKCAANSNEIIDKRKITNKNRYGVICVLQNDNIKEKSKNTILNKYGVEHYSKTNEYKNKIKESSLKRYGVENPFQNEEIKEKIKETNLQRYGVEYPLQNKEIQNKIKYTNIKKYGVEYIFQNEEIKEKIKETNLQRYGVENPAQNKEIREKQKQTCLEHYGIEYSLQNKEIREKGKQTNLKKYSNAYYTQTNEYKERVKETWLNKCGVENYKQSDEYKEKQKLETIEKYRNEFPKLNIIDYDISNSIMTCYCSECNKNYNINLMLLGDRLRYKKFKNPCTTCFPVDGHYSNEEKELVNYIKSIYSGEIIENNRNILNNKELDIYLPKLKIAFEYNGLYWHSLQYKNKEYHLNKTIECEKQDIQLVHIFENEWIENNENIKRYIKDLINNSVNIENYNLIFKKEENKIIVNRQFNNGKILEKYGYRLNKVLEPKLQEIKCNNINYSLYKCGYLVYIKE